MHEYNNELGSLCECGKRTRTVSCKDCFSPRLVCSECFIKNHRNNVFHWALAWDGTAGLFVKKDISTLRKNGYAIPLGHNGDLCPNVKDNREEEEPTVPPGIIFTVVHSNGVHGTRIQFCLCSPERTRKTQLLRAGLFPSTVKLPSAALTFQVMRLFEKQSYDTKCSAQDFTRSLQRLTDNVHIDEVQASLGSSDHKFFLTSTRILYKYFSESPAFGTI
jgi:hypothetical protein